MPRIFLLAGEASGDLHAALLAEALRRRRPELEIWGVGGERMAAAGVRLILRSDRLAVVGFLEVLEGAGRILAALRTVRTFLRSARPDLFVPVDFPDFNFRLLPTAARAGIPVIYYISPQVWAWRRRRIETLRRFVRRMVVIFPFEEALYREHGVPVSWVGHPFVDRIPPAEAPEAERARLGLTSDGPVVALLPGSRESEIRRIAPILAATRRAVDTQRTEAGYPTLRWVVGRAPGVRREALQPLGPAEILDGIDALRRSDLGLVASGTVTLEATLLGRPVIVVYRMHPWTYALARRMVQVEHIAMANLIAGTRLVPEFLQNEARPGLLAREVDRLLQDGEARDRIRQGLLTARERLGPPGAADRAAEVIVRELDRGSESRAHHRSASAGERER